MNVRTRLVSASIALLVGVGVLGVGGGAMAAPGDPGGRRFVPGAPGAGDVYFPFAGNGGYDVRHYDLDITYAPRRRTQRRSSVSCAASRPSTSWPPRTWTA